MVVFFRKIMYNIRVYLKTGNMTNSEGFSACCLGMLTVFR